MQCPNCGDSLVWQSDVDNEDSEGTPLIDTFLECFSCETFVTISTKVKG